MGMMFIDARYLHEYEEGHVEGAFWMPTEQFGTPGGLEVLSLLDSESPIIVYCGGGACDASKNVVRRLQEAGKRGARIMHDGYPAWKDAGHPTATGRPEIGGPS